MGPYQSLEWKFVDEKYCRLLVAPDFTESHSTRLIALRLLTPRFVAALLPAALNGSLRGALPPVDSCAVRLVRAIVLVETRGV